MKKILSLFTLFISLTGFTQSFTSSNFISKDIGFDDLIDYSINDYAETLVLEELSSPRRIEYKIYDGRGNIKIPLSNISNQAEGYPIVSATAETTSDNNFIITYYVGTELRVSKIDRESGDIISTSVIGVAAITPFDQILTSAINSNNEMILAIRRSSDYSFIRIDDDILLGSEISVPTGLPAGLTDLDINDNGTIIILGAGEIRRYLFSSGAFDRSKSITILGYSEVLIDNDGAGNVYVFGGREYQKFSKTQLTDLGSSQAAEEDLIIDEYPEVDFSLGQGWEANTHFGITNNGKFVAINSASTIGERYNFLTTYSGTSLSTVARFEDISGLETFDYGEYKKIKISNNGQYLAAYFTPTSRTNPKDDYVRIFKANQFPTGISLLAGNGSISENNEIGDAVSGVLVSQDPDGSTSFNYELVPGEGDEDNESFSISGAQIIAEEVFDYETQNEYSIRLRSSDPQNGWVEESFTITIQEVIEDTTPPTIESLSPEHESTTANTPSTYLIRFNEPVKADKNIEIFLMQEERAADVMIGSTTTVTPSGNGFDFSISGSLTPGDRYYILIPSGEITDNSGNPFAGTNASNWSFEVNAAPNNITLSNASIEEGNSAGDVIGNFTTFDANGSFDSYTYTFVNDANGPDNSSFTIDGNQLKANEVFDISTQPSYEINVRTTDDNGASFTKAFTVTVTGDPIVTIPDTNLKQIFVGRSTINTNEDNEIQVSEAEALRALNITANGVTDLTGLEAFSNLENLTMFSSDVVTMVIPQMASLDSLSLQGHLSMTSLDLSNVSSISYLAVNGNTSLSGLDLSSYTGLRYLQIRDNGLSTIDLSNQSNLEVLTVWGSGMTNLDISNNTNLKKATIRRNDLINSVTIGSNSLLSFLNLSENDISGVNVSGLTALDTLYAGSNPLTSLDVSNNSQLSLLNLYDADLSSLDLSANTTLDGLDCRLNENLASLNLKNGNNSDLNFMYATFTSLTCVEVSDISYAESSNGWIIPSGATYANNCNNSVPTAISLAPTSIDENAGADAVVGELSTTDADVDDTHTYQLITGFGDNSTFSVDNTNDQLLANSSFDFETKSSYSIKIRSTDDAGDFVAEEFTIDVNDLDEKPNLVSVSPDYDATQVGLDASLTLTFDKDISSVGTSGSLRIFNKTTGLQFRQFSSGSFTVEITGPTITIDLPGGVYFPAGGEFYVIVEEDFVTSAVDFSESWEGIQDEETWTFSTIPRPQITSVSPEGSVDPQNLELSIDFDQNIAQSAANTKRLRIRRVSDDETVSFYRGSDFAINGSTATVNVDGDLPYNTDFYVTIDDNIFVQEGEPRNSNPAVNDPSFWTFSTINAPNNAPTAISLAPSFIDENAGADAVVGDLSTTDADAGDTHTYELVAGFGDNNAFSIDNTNDQLLANSSFDYETKNSYSIKIRSTDDAGDFVEEEITIDVNDLDDTAPSISTLLPEDGAIDVGVNEDFAIIFEEPVQFIGSNTIKLFRNDGTLVEEFGSNVSITSGNDVYFAPSSLEYGTNYYITIPNGTLEDLAGNSLAGFINTNIWSFKTEKADQTITITTIPDKLATDAPFAISANVDSGLPLTYSVSGPATNNGATVTLTGETGTVEVTVSQAGNDQFNPATAMTTFLVSDALKTNQSITFDAITDKVFGETFLLSASATSSLPVNFRVTEGENLVSLNGNEVTTVGVGNVIIEAFQEGNEQFNAAAPQSQSFNIAKLNQTITFDALADKIFGDAPFTLTASATSTLPVTFTVSSGPASLSGYEVTITGAGEVTIAANQPGNANFNAAPEVTRSFTVNKADQSITLAQITDKDLAESPVSITASTTSGLPLSYQVSGPATLTGTRLSLDDIGTIVVTVSQNGNENFNTAQPQQTSFDVTDQNRTSQTITFPQITDKIFGQPGFALNATSSSNLPIQYQVINGPISIAGTTVTINGAGQATIAATQNGNADFNPAEEVRQSFTINKANQSISFNTIEDKVFGDADFNITATASSGLPVSYSVLDGPASVTGNTVSLNGAGTILLAANQLGNANYNPAPQVSRSFDVEKADQFIDIQQIDDPLTDDGPIDIVASSNSGLPLVFDITGPATVNGSVITLTGSPGQVTLTASQPGNQDYKSATQSISFSVIQSKQDQLITFDQIADQTYGGQITLQAIADSGLPVSFEALTSNVIIQGNTVTFSGTGDASIRAYQPGNQAFLEAESIQNFTITPASLTLTAEDQSRTYGSENPELGFTAEGLVYNESLSDALSVMPHIVASAEQSDPPGTYSIRVTGGMSENYVLVRVDGILTVNKAVLEVRAENTSRFVGESTTEYPISYSGFVNEDDESSLTTLPTATSAATVNSGVGTYLISPQGGSSDLYQLTYVTGILTIEGGSVSGVVQGNDGPLSSGVATLWKKDSEESFSMVTQTSLNADGSFVLSQVDAGAHTLSITPASQDMDNYFITYLGNTNNLADADVFDLTQGSPAIALEMVSKPAQNGNGGSNSIEGVLVLDPESSGGRILKGTRLEDAEPIPHTEVWLLDEAGTIIGHDLTDDTGQYSFSGLTSGNYQFRVNYLGQILNFNEATVEIFGSNEGFDVTTTIDGNGQVIVINNTITSIGLNGPNWKVYPNPAVHQVNVTIDQIGDWSVRLINLNGQELFQKTLDRKELLIDVSLIPKGMYILMLTNDELQLTKQKQLMIK